jgi:hypothetical protein
VIAERSTIQLAPQIAPSPTGLALNYFAARGQRHCPNRQKKFRQVVFRRSGIFEIAQQVHVVVPLFLV